MCFLKAPKAKLPPKPRVPTPSESAVKAEERRRLRLADASGRDDNILTSPLGASDYGRNSRRRVTLGVS
ncbi:MAG: hypothetical protein C0605_08015 [Hyphomicrobiales bacterium]|nr:MAG: hypothetical protein C0605_08015 [Hyphomicrobiales bacterium]